MGHAQCHARDGALVSLRGAGPGHCAGAGPAAGGRHVAHAQPALAVAARPAHGLLQLVGLLLLAAYAGGRIHRHCHAHTPGAHSAGPLCHERAGLAAALAHGGGRSAWGHAGYPPGWAGGQLGRLDGAHGGADLRRVSGRDQPHDAYRRPGRDAAVYGLGGLGGEHAAGVQRLGHTAKSARMGAAALGGPGRHAGPVPADRGLFQSPSFRGLAFSLHRGGLFNADGLVVV